MSDCYVKLVSLTAGLSSQQEHVKEKLTLGEFYPVSAITIGGWMTTINIPEVGDFNSVFFEFYDSNKNFLEKEMFAKEISHLTNHRYYRG